MQFNDTTNKNGIIQDCERNCGMPAASISGNATLLGDFTAHCNTELRLAWHLIFRSTGVWKYDDGNQTNLPFAVQDLSSSTRDYALPSDSLTIDKIKIANSSGIFYQLDVRTQDVINETLSGTPKDYFAVGKTVRLDVKPSWSYSGGFKVEFTRGSVAFVVADTTKTPGFASEYHDLISIGASIRWLKLKKPESLTLPQLEKDYIRINAALEEFYKKQYKSFNPKLQRARQSFR